jgi:cyclohexanone monooxygenase
MVNAIEQHVDFIARCIGAMEERGDSLVEPEREAEDAWVAHTNEIARHTLYWSCSSWYLGDNIPGKPRVFMPYVGIPVYNAKCEDVVAKGYEGFAFS